MVVSEPKYNVFYWCSVYAYPSHFKVSSTLVHTASLLLGAVSLGCDGGPPG